MKLFISAGEASADQHGAHLLRELRALTPVDVRGVGGERMRSAGLLPWVTSEELSVMGFVEVARHLPRIFRLWRSLGKQAVAFAPDVAVLIDSPDFHLPLAKHLHRAGIPVVLYVSPQLWAWRQGRVRKIRAHVKEVFCILPFEVDFYAAHGVSARFVGHPLVDELEPVLAGRLPDPEEAWALMPGSRWHEVRALLPVMVEAFAQLAAQVPGLRGKVIVAPGLASADFMPLLGPLSSDLELVEQDRYRQLASCRGAFVASGTATLVCAMLGVPMVVTYRLHPLSYLLAKWLVKVPHIGLVNLVAGERVAPELVQGDLTGEKLCTAGLKLLGREGLEQRAKLAEVRQRLGQPGASRRAAEALLALVRGR